jgi:hypothetical protein
VRGVRILPLPGDPKLGGNQLRICHLINAFIDRSIDIDRSRQDELWVVTLSVAHGDDQPGCQI